MLVGQIAAVSIAVVGVVVVAQILVLSGARGQARLLGVLGTALMLLGLVAGFAFQSMAQWFFGRVGDRFAFVLAADRGRRGANGSPSAPGDPLDGRRGLADVDR